ncbi:ribonuclease H-like domain-containing protein [Tanacetum coccineum]|uniref:Ribonuclease H-like domain-containing protein n=1 Tax=Tanacetum coccineum TaxID=301880 RepID=A0ABQ5H556_9ASTR
MNYGPVTAGNQTNKNAGNKDNGTQQYILQPLLYNSPQSSEYAVADDAGKKTNEEPTNKAELDNLLVQQKEGYTNSTNRDSTISQSISTAGQNFTNADDLPTDPLILDLEDTGIFIGAYDDEDVGAEADLNNLETTMNVNPIPTTRIYKDHLKDQIFGDINSATQTRRMTKISEEHAMNLVNLPKGKRAIGAKWVYKNKKDERGIVVRNKARLVAQDYTQEEGIDYDEVFAPVARIEVIRLFLAYASFMGLIVYQMDVKSAFLYGTIEEEVKHSKTNKALLKDEEAEDVDVHLYRSMIGSLMYLTAFRPDIMFAVLSRCSGLCLTRDGTTADDEIQVSTERELVGINIDDGNALWNGIETATVKTVDNGEQEITATVDGKEFTITEASVRRHLQLANVDSYEKKDFLGNQTPLFPTNLQFKQKMRKFRHPFEPQPPPSTAQTIHEEPIPNVTSKPIPNVLDEAVYEEWDDRVERATTTAASLDAAQASDDEEDLEDSSKQERMIEEIDQDVGVTLVTPTYSQEINLKTHLGVFSASMPVNVLLYVQEGNKDKVRVHEEASSFNIEEWENIQATIKVDEELAQRIQAEEREKYSVAEKQLKRLSFDELKDLLKQYNREVVSKETNEASGQFQDKPEEEENRKHIEDLQTDDDDISVEEVGFEAFRSNIQS